jgi:hypothetical protein
MSYLAKLPQENNKQNQNAATYFSRLNGITIVRYVDQVSEEGVK